MLWVGDSTGYLTARQTTVTEGSSLTYESHIVSLVAVLHALETAAHVWPVETRVARVKWLLDKLPLRRVKGADSSLVRVDPAVTVEVGDTSCSMADAPVASVTFRSTEFATAKAGAPTPAGNALVPVLREAYLAVNVISTLGTELTRGGTGLQATITVSILRTSVSNLVSLVAGGSTLGATSFSVPAEASVTAIERLRGVLRLRVLVRARVPDTLNGCLASIMIWQRW